MTDNSHNNTEISDKSYNSIQANLNRNFNNINSSYIDPK